MCARLTAGATVDEEHKVVVPGVDQTSSRASRITSRADFSCAAAWRTAPAYVAPAELASDEVHRWALELVAGGTGIAEMIEVGRADAQVGAAALHPRAE